MKRLMFAAIATIALAVTSTPAARAQDAEHRNIGLGFHNVEAPVGLRWWFSGQKVALDLGLGYASVPEDGAYPDESLTSFAIDAGVPFVISSWSRVHVILRPGILYQSSQFTSTAPPEAFDTETATNMFISGEIEAEVFLADNFSVSASHGIAFNSFDSGIDGDDTDTSFGTIGNNFTNIGFHIYFLGGSQ